MARARGSYPHPVVDDSDDTDSIFLMSNIQIEVEVERLRLQFEATLTDEDLKQHLDQGRARMVLRWKCSETFRLGQVEPQKLATLARSHKYAVSLPQEELDGLLELELQIVAAEAIPAYRLSRQNADYGETAFSISSGDVLAVGGYTTIKVGKLYDPMRPPLQSCFLFEMDSEVPSGIRISYTGSDQVTVRISPAVYTDFASLRGREDFQIAVVMLPALMETLAYMQYERASGDVLDDFAWYQALSNLIDQHNLRDKPILEQAQTILEDPIGRTFTKELSILADGQDPS